MLIGIDRWTELTVNRGTILELIGVETDGWTTLGTGIDCGTLLGTGRELDAGIDNDFIDSTCDWTSLSSSSISSSDWALVFSSSLLSW